MVKFVLRVIDLGGGDDARIGVKESLRHAALIHRVAAGQALHLHDVDARALGVRDVHQQPLHLRAGGDGLAADDFGVFPGDAMAVARCQLMQRVAVSGKSLALAARLGIHVGAGLAQVHDVVHGWHLLGFNLWIRVADMLAYDTVFALGLIVL